MDFTHPGNELIYLDPHTTQSFVDSEENGTVDDKSFHCQEAPHRMKIMNLDPSVALVGVRKSWMHILYLKVMSLYIGKGSDASPWTEPRSQSCLLWSTHSSLYITTLSIWILGQVGSCLYCRELTLFSLLSSFYFFQEAL